MDEVECVVIGAGVIGLAAARALALTGREVIILERTDSIGSGISSRNSEVIHAGIYYPANSLKARFCVEGRDQLYAYCRTHNVAHRRCGKLIVATMPVQVGELESIAAAARRNGVTDIEQLTSAEAIAIEPELNCLSALNSPSTGIIDSHGYMLSLLGDAEAHGAVIAYGASVASMRVESNGVAIWLEGDGEPSLKARLVVNAAGLDAAPLTHRVEGLDPAHAHPSYYAKGSYFTLAGRAPFSRLVYPAPEPGGLGVHLTLDLGGQARFGPDVEWIETPHYDVDPRRAEKFYAAVRAYWPGLHDGALTPAYSGIRPKLSGPGEPARDFVIEGPSTHGARGLINLLGIESPGLTSSLAIADYVATLGAESLDA
ncbi:MAG: NAD(P)/FAD-dependent oxidoreductase [Hyphomonadaceae bacterium]